MENKLEQLTKRLYDEGLSKGRSDAEALVAAAKAEAGKILDDAKAEADKIREAAEKDAQELAGNTKTEIALAGRQAISALKEGIAGMIVAKAASGTVNKACMDPDFIKDMLIAVAGNWSGSSSGKVSLRALLPKEMEQKLDKKFSDSAKALLDGGIEIAYKEGIGSGFKIGPVKGGYHISFTDADFDALLAEYLRPRVAEILYGDK